MIRGIFTVFFCVLTASMFGQTYPPVDGVTDGDYYTGQSGVWSNTAVWYRWNGTAWINPATAAPANSNAAAITIGNGHTITLGAAATIDQAVIEVGGQIRTSTFVLTVANGAGDDLTVNGSLQVDGGGTMRLAASQTVIRVNGSIANVGTVANSSATRLFFNAGSTYDHQFSSPSGNIPSASWNATSTCRVTGDLADSPSNLDQTFGNFIWDTPVLQAGSIDLDGELSNVAGNLTISNTDVTTLTFSGSSPSTLTIGGNLTLGAGAKAEFTSEAQVDVNVGGSFNFSSDEFVSASGAGTVNLSVSGDVNFNSGSFEVGLGTTNLSVGGSFTNSATAISNTTLGGSSPLNLTFNGTGVRTYTSTVVPAVPLNYATSGTVNLNIDASSFLAGAGSFNLASGTTLTLLSLDGNGALRNGTAGGNIRNTGERIYNGTIVYGGAALQYMSSQHPGAVATRIANSAGVNMQGSVNFTGVLDLDEGLLTIANYTLTVSTVLHNGGSMGVNGNSSLVINGTGDYGDLALSGTVMRNLTINRAGEGVVNQATSDLRIAGTVNLTAGQLALAANTITRLNGPFNVTGGTMSAVSGSQLLIGGSGAMPSSVFMTGALNRLTMNRASTTLNLSNAAPDYLDVSNLSLTNGIVNNAGGLRIANGGLVTRINGSFASAVGAVGVYDLTYGNFSAGTLTPGFEMPTPPSVALRALTVNNTSAGTPTLSLTGPVDAAGTIRVRDGVLASNDFAISTGGNFTVDTAGLFEPGLTTLTFDGAVTQSLSAPEVLTMTNIVIDKSAASNFTLSSRLDITNSFAIINTASTANVGNDRLRLMSSDTATAYVPELVAGAVVNGQVIVQRQLPNPAGIRAYRYIAPSVTGSTVADWQAEFPVTGPFANPSTGTYNGTKLASANPSLFYYDPLLVTGSDDLLAGYVNYPTSGNSSAASLTLGRGYAAFIRSTTVPSTYDTRGRIGQGDVSVVVGRNTAENGGWNLVGNPYPAPIDWDLVAPASSEILDAIYFTDNTENSGTLKVSYIDGVAVPESFNGQIAAGQAFWVRAATAGVNGSINFRESQKVSGQTQFYREGDISDLLRIVMKKGSAHDEIAIRLHDDATSAFDSEFDAYKFDATGLNISSLTSNNDRLSINSVGGSQCDNNVALFIDGGTNGTYSLEFTGAGTFSADLQLYLNDKVENKKVSLLSTSSYTFTVTDAVKLKDRFEIVFEGPSITADIAVKAEATCDDNSMGLLTLQDTQADVKYTAMWNGNAVSAELSGTGGELIMPIVAGGLPEGENEITISAKRATCAPLVLTNKATLSVVNKPTITSAKDGTSCPENPVTLSASAVGTTTFNWYESENAAAPITGQHSGEFTTPSLNKTKTYYVAAVNSLGCESLRLPVTANITNLDPVSISAEGYVLSSSYSQGNQWYLDGVKIDGANTQTIEAIVSGVYTVKVSTNDCTLTSEGREMLVTGVDEYAGDMIIIYPNPTADNVTITVKSANQSILARLIHPSGIEVGSVLLSGDKIKSGELNLNSLPDGVYLIRVQEGNKLFTKKLSKIK